MEEDSGLLYVLEFSLKEEIMLLRLASCLRLLVICLAFLPLERKRLGGDGKVRSVLEGIRS